MSSTVAYWPRYALPRGTVLNGYTIERVLGSGGFGVTYLARDDLGQPFAIKEYFPRDFVTRQELSVLAEPNEHASLFADCLDRFRRDAQSWVRLSGGPTPAPAWRGGDLFYGPSAPAFWSWSMSKVSHSRRYSDGNPEGSPPRA